MSLRDYEATAARVCLTPAPDDHDLATLGTPERWRIYRTMVRARMQRVCKTAMKRTAEAMGEEAFGALVDRWLAESPPRTRFFRELPSAMARWAMEHEALDAPAHARELMRYEIAVWEVKAEDDRDLPAVEDFHFEGTPSFSPASRLLEASWGVDRRDEDGGCEPFEGALLVFRTPDFRARCLRLNPLAAALVRELRRAETDGRTVTEAVQRAAESQGVAIDQKLIEGLSSLLEKLLTRGVLRGCLTTKESSDEA